MIKRIDLFMPTRSRYGVLHHFTKCLHDALKRSGVNCRLLEAQKDNPGPFLTQIFNDPPDCTLSFNGVLPDAEGRFLCDLLKIPHVACVVDSPNHFFPLIKSPYNIITCVDRFACEFFKGMNFENVLFMPHAVEKDLEPHSDAQRTFDVLLLSSCIDYESIGELWKKKYPPSIRKALHKAAELTLADTDTSYVQAFVIALDSLRPKIKTTEIAQFDFVEGLNELEFYIRGLDRIRLIQSIKDARVDIFGADNSKAVWEKYLGKKQRNIRIHEEVSFEQALELMKHAKILLNSCLWIKNGAHERIFTGLASGALVLTNDNSYMRENFTDDKNILFYKPFEMDKINDKINGILQNESKRQKIAKKGRDVVMKHHTWDHRAAQLLKELPPILKKIKKQNPK